MLVVRNFASASRKVVKSETCVRKLSRYIARTFASSWIDCVCAWELAKHRLANRAIGAAWGILLNSLYVDWDPRKPERVDQIREIFRPDAASVILNELLQGHSDQSVIQGKGRLGVVEDKLMVKCTQLSVREEILGT